MKETHPPPAATGTKRTFHWAWIVLPVCFIDLFVNYSIRLGYGVLLPEMIRDLGITRTAAGSVFNAYLFAYIAFTPLAGYLTDRIGARGVIAVCIGIVGAGAFLMGMSHSFFTACIFFGLVGIGAAGLWTPVITVVQRWFAPTHRGRALGVLSTGYGLAFAVAGIAFPVIIAAQSWRTVWYLLGAAAFILVLANGLLLRNDPASAGFLSWGTKTAPGAATPTAPQAGGGSFFRGVLGRRTFWLIGFSYLSIAYCLYGVTTFLVDYARHEVGLPLAGAGALATVHGICQVAGVLTILPLSDYLGRRKTILISNFFITLSVAGILFAGTASPWALYGFVGMLAVFYGVTFPIYGACAGDYFPERWMGTVIGSWTPFYGLGAMLSHWVGGMIRDGSGSYTGAFTINMLAAAIAFLLFYPVEKKRDGGK
jgi:sugar phosphate permease